MKCFFRGRGFWVNCFEVYRKYENTYLLQFYILKGKHWICMSLRTIGSSAYFSNLSTFHKFRLFMDFGCLCHPAVLTEIWYS